MANSQSGQSMPNIQRQRWSALWNGIIIGLGLSSLMLGIIPGAVPLVLGIILEVYQRRRMQSTPP